MLRGLGHCPDRPKVANDEPDKRFLPEKLGLRTTALPTEATLDDLVLDVLDQGMLGSCVANAGMQALRMAHVRQGIKNPRLGSRLFGYFFARAYDGATKIDGGTEIRLFYQGVNKFGFPPEDLWTYDDAPVMPDGGPGKFSLLPATVAVRGAYDQHTPAIYRRLDADGEALLQSIQTCIASARQPVEFGTLVTKAYANFEIGDGVVDVPSPDAPIAGGHAQLIIGYRVLASGKRLFKILGSWSDAFGDHGTCWYTEEYILWAATTDLWTVDHTPPFSG